MECVCSWVLNVYTFRKNVLVIQVRTTEDHLNSSPCINGLLSMNGNCPYASYTTMSSFALKPYG